MTLTMARIAWRAYEPFTNRRLVRRRTAHSPSLVRRHVRTGMASSLSRAGELTNVCQKER